MSLLLDIYIYSSVDKRFLNYLMKALLNESDKQRIERMNNVKEKLYGHIDDKNYLTIYRGEYEITGGNKSIEINKAVSFTLTPKIAEKFACRFYPYC